MTETVEHTLSEPSQAVYDGFMSYSHAADGLLAPRLQSALQRFAKPWWKRRAVRIFRDESSLSANPHLWSSITEALDTSGWFILLLSPDAATSEWVNQEIDYWVQNRDPKKILPVVTDGTFGWTHGDVTGDAVPPALEGVFAEEPRWVDVRWARDEDQLDLKDPRFADAIADIASAVRGIPKDDLASEEVRQHRRTTRSAWGAGALVLLLGIIATIAAVQATRNADEAQGNALLAAARNVSRSDMDLALLLTLEAAELLGSGDGSVEGELHNIFMVGTEVRSLATAAEAHAKSFAVAERPHTTQIAVTAAGSWIRLLEADTMEPVATFGEPVAAFSSSIPSIAFDQLGERLAAIDTSGKVTIWDVETQSVLTEIETNEGATGRVMFGPDGDRLITSIHTRTAWDIDSGRALWRNEDRAFSIGGADISYDHRGRWLAWAARETGEVAIVDLATGERIWTISLPGAVAVEFHPRHDVLAVKSQNSGTEFYDLASGAPALVGAIPGGAPTAIEFDDDGGLLAVGGDLGVEIHRPADPERPGADWEQVAFLPTGASFGFSYAFLSDGTGLAIGHKQGAGVFSLEITGETSRIQLDSPAWTIEAVPGTSKVYTAHPPLMGRNAVSLYDLDSGAGRLLSDGDLTAPGWAVSRASSPRAAVAYLPEQNLVALLDPSTGSVVTELEHPGDSAPRVLDVSEDGSTVAAGLVGTSEIVMWDGGSGEITHRFPVGGIGDIRSIRLSPVDRDIAVGGDTGIVLVDPESPAEARLLSAQGSILNVDFSPDGRLLAAADDTFGFLYVYDLVDASGDVRISAPGALDPAFTSDGRQLILGAAQSGVIAFDTETWERRWTIPVDNLPGGVLTLDVDGDHIVFSPIPGYLYGVTLDFDELLEIARTRINRGFTAVECTQYRIDPCPSLDEIRGR